jgi:hypothetical protein
VNVRVVATKGESALVEWQEGDDLTLPGQALSGLKRAYIPADKVTDGQACSDVLAAGIPYGVAFEDVLVPSVTATRIAQELRRRGLWTKEDVLTRPGEVLSALQAAYGIDLGRLQAACAKHALEEEATK